MKDKKNFYPVFIVGPPRCGTTMLAVLFDRHSRIAVPPETQFFTAFLAQQKQKYGSLEKKLSREQMVDDALGHDRIADMELGKQEVLSVFKNYSPEYKNLFRALLECYMKRENKQRPAEKSPRHLLHTPDILSAFPEAKIICILRDGRDMVRSRMKVNWSTAKNPRRFGLYCNDWSDCVRAALKYEKKYSSKKFMIVRYEDIILNPENELRHICNFIGEEFEPAQLDPSVKTDVVPGWENDWKAKARSSLDKSRVQAWWTEAPKEQVWQMNMRMGRMLKKAGYKDVNLKGCPFTQRFILFVKKVPYVRYIRPFSRFGLRLLKTLRICKI